jgi:hypothetical protein
MENLSLQIDLATAASALIGVLVAFSGGAFFAMRFREHARENRAIRLDSKGLDFLFDLRDDFKRAVEVLEDEIADELSDQERRRHAIARLYKTQRNLWAVWTDFRIFCDGDKLSGFEAEFEATFEALSRFIGELQGKDPCDREILEECKARLYSLWEETDLMILKVYESTGRKNLDANRVSVKRRFSSPGKPVNTCPPAGGNVASNSRLAKSSGNHNS